MRLIIPTIVGNYYKIPLEGAHYYILSCLVKQGEVDEVFVMKNATFVVVDNRVSFKTAHDAVQFLEENLTKQSTPPLFGTRIGTPFGEFS